MDVLKNKRVLIVEDEFLIAAMAEDFLTGLGARIVGPAATVAKALQLIDAEAVDAALLDVNLNGERSDPVAAQLHARRIPFVVTTGYGASELSGLGAITLSKPYSLEDLSSVLANAISAQA